MSVDAHAGTPGPRLARPRHTRQSPLFVEPNTETRDTHGAVSGRGEQRV